MVVCAVTMNLFFLPFLACLFIVASSLSPFEQWYEDSYNTQDLKWRNYKSGYPYMPKNRAVPESKLKTYLPKDAEWITYIPNPGHYRCRLGLSL